MKGLIKKLLHCRADKHYFLITSHGQTASMWLAAVLNRIPEIFCTHGYLYPPKGADLAELSQEEWDLRQACFERFGTLSMEDYFAELNSATDKRIIGNVLAFYLGRLVSKMGDKMKRRKFTVVNVVRHPVTRLTSTIKTWTTDETDFIPGFVELDFTNRCDHLKNFILKSHEVDFKNNKNKIFTVALLAMEDIARDVTLAKAHHIQNVKYEDITTNKNHFKNLVEYITNNRINLPPAFLDDLFTSKRINAHNNTGISEAAKQYHSWDTWKQEAFKFTLQKNDMLKAYDGLHYDFSFLTS